MTERSSSNLGMSQRFASWPTALIGILIIKAALSLAVRPGSFIVSYSGISYLVLLVLATSLAVRNGKQNTLGSRPFWVFFAIACGLWSVNQLMQLHYEFVLHMESPNSSIAEPMLFLHIVPFMAALAAFPHRNLSDQKSRRAILDAFLLLFFWSFLYAYIVFPYKYVGSPTNYGLRFDILYLAENLVLVSAAGILTLRAHAHWKSIYLHLFGASVLYALSSAVANIAIDSGGYVNGKLYGLGLTASVCWFVWIPLRARQLSWAEAGTTPSNSESTTSSWAIVTVAVISIPIAWELFLRDETTSARTLRTMVALAVIGCLAFAAYIRERLLRSELGSRLGLADNRLRLAMKSGKCVAWDWDIKSGRDSWFGDLQTQFGIPSDTYFGRVEDFHRRIHPEDRERVAKAVRDAMQNRERYTAEFRILWPDRTVRWVSAEGDFYYAANGKPQRMLGISVDITDRKQAEAQLRESEEQFRTLAEAIPQLCWMAHGDGRGFWNNQRWYSYTGTTPEQMEGWGWQSVHDPQTLPTVLERWNASIAKSEPFDMVLPLRGADGVFRQFLTRVMPLKDADRRVVRWFGTYTDVTELRDAHEKRYRQLFENMSEGIAYCRMLFDDSGRPTDCICLEVNTAFPRLTGLEEVVGKRMTDLIPGIRESTPELFETFGRVVATGQPEKLEIEIKPLGIWLSSSVHSPEKDHFVAVFDNITERKRSEELLLRAEKLTSAGRMAAAIAHEINNPLDAVMNLLFLAANTKELPESARQYLETADDELKRVSHITRQSLGFYRESSAPALTSVSAVLNSSLDLVKSRIKLKKAIIEKQFNGDVQITAIAGELRQVFSNLLSNSLDAIDERGTIKLRVSASRHRVRVTVADNGKGVPRSIRRRIFEPFFSTKGTVGTGLGLWVSQQIIEKHSGTIRVRSSSDGLRRGTTFSVRLPLEPTPSEGQLTVTLADVSGRTTVELKT